MPVRSNKRVGATRYLVSRTGPIGDADAGPATRPASANAAAAAASPSIAGVKTPIGLPAFHSWGPTTAGVPPAIAASASGARGLRMYRPATIGTKSDTLTSV